jgi:hypothetical protein
VREHGDGPDLRDVLPQHVQATAPDEHAVDLGDPELLDVLVERDQLLGEQHLADVGVDDRLDAPHIADPCPAYHHIRLPITTHSVQTCHVGADRNTSGPADVRH